MIINYNEFVETKLMSKGSAELLRKWPKSFITEGIFGPEVGYSNLPVTDHVITRAAIKTLGVTRA